MTPEPETTPDDVPAAREEQHPANMEPQSAPKVTFGGAYLVGLGVALTSGVAVGLAESAWTIHRVGTSYASLSDWPWMIFLGTAGRSVLTYALLWVFFGAITGLPLAWGLVRLSRKGSPLRGEGLFLAVCIVEAGIICLPVGLDMAGKLNLLTAVEAAAATAVLGLLVLVAFWWGARTRPIRWCVSLLRWSVVPSLGLVILGAGLMSVTPLRGAEHYKVPLTERKPPSRSEGSPDILWIVMDTVRADHLSCYDYELPTTPFLERLASKSMVYDRAVASGYWTVPTHASMFTGLPARQHGASREATWLEDEHVTLAELLSGAGYQCAMFANNPYIRTGCNFGQGFEYAPPHCAYRRLYIMAPVRWCEWLGIRPVLPWFEGDAGAAITNAEVAGWLDGEHDPSRPFMIFVNYMEAHMPYPVPRRHRALFMDRRELARSYVLRHRAHGDILDSLLARYNLLDSTAIPPRDLEILEAQYDAALRYLDERIEELLSVLDQRGLLDNAVVVVTSDHGESLGERSKWGHHYGVYDTLVRVPMMIRLPGGEPNGRVKTLVQTADLYATLARCAEVSVPDVPGAQSWDLARLNPFRAEERMAVSEYLSHERRRISWASDQNPDFDASLYNRRMRAAIQGQYKLIWTSDGRNELYDLSADPAETDNIIESRPGVAGRLSGKLRHWVETVPEYTYPEGKKKPDLPAEMIQQLKALGYMQ